MLESFNKFEINLLGFMKTYIKKKALSWILANNLAV